VTAVHDADRAGCNGRPATDADAARDRDTTVATFAIVTGGGTSGHVLPALAIAEGLVDAGHPVASVHYVGTTRGVESRLVPPTGHPFTLLDVVGLQRSLSRRNLAFVPKLVRSTWQARG
jgi:UDP-N-acetylglucosamine--N-acetylmuramyl-(pentapeptide) pyrophosphoryl-undecaprenol N-acetylglucosamine transferase